MRQGAHSTSGSGGRHENRPRPGARAALSYALELRLGRQLITAALRMTVQLLLVGLVVLMHQDISLML